MTRARSQFFSLALLVVTASVALEPARAQAQATTPAAAPKTNAHGLVERGRSLYEDQLYEESAQTLSAALLRPDSSREDKLRVYQYLAFDYIVLGRNEEAENATRALFVLDPEFTLPSSESPRFREFFDGVKQRWESEGRPGIEKKAEVVKPVVLRHAPQAQVEENKAFEVRGSIDDADLRVTHLKLFVRAGTKGRFTSMPVPLSGSTFHTSIGAPLVRSPLVEYYFEAYDSSGLPIASRGDAAQALRVAVREKSGAGWVLPVALGGGIVGAAAIVGVMALAGVFSGSAAPTSTVTVLVRE